MRDGQQVTYVGDGGDGLHLGDRGQVLAVVGSGSHVLWRTGVLHGQVTLVENEDIVREGRAQTVEAAVADALDSPLVTVAVRETYDESGEAGLLNALNEAGHLAAFTQIAEEAAGFIASRIRRDPAFRAVLAHLDGDEGDRLVTLASTVLLRDAFGGAE